MPDAARQTIVCRIGREQAAHEATLLERLAKAVSAKLSEIFVAP
jgi:hypothetical protein